MIDQLLTIEDICARLNIGKNTAYQLVKNLQHIKIGRKLRVHIKDLNDYIEKEIYKEKA